MNALDTAEYYEPEQIQPEHRLLWAILRRTIEDINQAPQQTKENQYRRFRDRRAALSFLTAEYESSPPPFSFQWIAEELSDGEPDYLMARLRQMVGLTA